MESYYREYQLRGRGVKFSVVNQCTYDVLKQYAPVNQNIVIIGWMARFLNSLTL
jgi:hypothetical protein